MPATPAPRQLVITLNPHERDLVRELSTVLNQATRDLTIVAFGLAAARGIKLAGVVGTTAEGDLIVEPVAAVAPAAADTPAESPAEEGG